MTAPRIARGSRREVGVAVMAFARLAGRFAGTEPPGVFLTLGRHRRLFWRWLWFAGGLMPGGRLPRRETEMVILRVAHLRGSAYEWDQHQRLGRRAGLSKEAIEALRDPRPGGGWSPRERAVLAAVDELDAQGDLSDAVWDDLSAHLDEREIIELLMLAGHYQMLATALNALRVAPDAPRPR